MEGFDLLEQINSFVWGVPVLGLLLGSGLIFSIRTGFVQFRLFPEACRRFWSQFRSRDRSSFRSLCTALAATVGTGNIAGVAGAIAIGGPGAVFWMWISGFLGMATKYTEAVLSVVYRRAMPDGSHAGGTMWIIENGLGKRFRPMAYVYCVLGVIASFGVGNATQINAVVSAVRAACAEYGYSIRTKSLVLFGFVLAVMTWLMLRGGANRIGTAAELLVPFASAAYILLCICLLVQSADRIPLAIAEIIKGAFTPQAVTGGAVGSLWTTLRIGISRGTFTNEAGMGTACVAHGAAEVKHPAHQGMMGIMEVFIDTIVICTVTALTILVSGIPIPYGSQAGSELTAAALSVYYGPWAALLLAACMACFAFATILGWGLYAGRFLEYLLGSLKWRHFATVQACAVLLGALLRSEVLWQFSELTNALMAIPNLITLLLLCGQVEAVTEHYRK